MILPTLIPKMKNITKISLYSNYSLCLNKEGHVFGFGSNFKGRMGFSSNIQDQVFIPLQVPVLVNIVKIDAGYFHSLALDREG
jgi:alpha-tubulin suppressor-like RCC1 family protein